MLVETRLVIIEIGRSCNLLNDCNGLKCMSNERVSPISRISLAYDILFKSRGYSDRYSCEK